MLPKILEKHHETCFLFPSVAIALGFPTCCLPYARAIPMKRVAEPVLPWGCRDPGGLPECTLLREKMKYLRRGGKGWIEAGAESRRGIAVCKPHDGC